MALILGSNIAKGSLFELSEYESAFRPWWDALQDYVMYSTIIIGLFAMPSANAKADCAPVYSNTTSPAHHSFVNSRCTREEIPLFISFFPYLVFIGPSLLAIMEKFFSKASSIGPKMNHFYRLLVEDNKRRESTNPRLSKRNVKEIENVYNMSSSFFATYTVKNIFQFLFSIVFVVLMAINFFDTIFDCQKRSCEVINYRRCDLGGVELTCVVPDVYFFVYVSIVAAILMLIYILANFYTLLWIGIRPIRKLGRFLRSYKSGVRRYFRGKAEMPTEADALLDVYGGIKSLDIEILLDLLAEKLGLEVALRIITLIDDEFSLDWRSQPKPNSHLSTGTNSISVEFQEPPIARYIEPKYQERTILTAKLDLPGNEKSDSVQSQAFSYGKTNPSVNVNQAKAFDQRQDFFLASFSNLNSGQKYNIILATFLNGTLMGETRVTYWTKPDPPRNLVYSWKYDFNNSEIQFRLELTWSMPGKQAAGDRNCHFIVELENSTSIVSTVVQEEKFSTIIPWNEPIKIRIWSLLITPDGNVQSEVPVETEMDGIPSDMKALADHLQISAPKDVSSYSYRLSIFSQVAKELKYLNEEIQRVSSMSRSAKFEYMTDGQLLLESLANESGLPDIDS